MIVLALRTDNPQAEWYLFEEGILVGQVLWQAHRELSATIHSKLQALLSDHDKTIRDIEGVIFYQGPGSFTGLRIGASVVNALGGGLGIPAVAARDDTWREVGLRNISRMKSFTPIEPYYGSDAHITLPKK